MNEEEAVVKATTALMLALGEPPLRYGRLVLDFHEYSLQAVERRSQRRVRKPAPNHQPPRTSGVK